MATGRFFPHFLSHFWPDIFDGVAFFDRRVQGLISKPCSFGVQNSEDFTRIQGSSASLEERQGCKVDDYGMAKISSRDMV